MGRTGRIGYNNIKVQIMEVSDILSEDMILADINADSKRQLLEQLSTVIADKCDLDKSAVFEAILERENLGSTGYGNGVGYPHARIEGLQKVVAMVARWHSPLDYESVDSQGVDIVAMMVSPENSGNDHLQTLAVLSRALKNEKTRQTIRQAKNAHEIYVALQK